MIRLLSPLEKQILSEQMKEYTENNFLSPYERKQLQRWVKAGNSPMNNPWKYCYSDGWEMEYILALRMDEEIYETLKRIAEEN